MNSMDDEMTKLIEASFLDKTDVESLIDAACYLIGRGRYDEALDKIAKIPAEKHSVQVSFLEFLIYCIQGDKTKASEKAKDNIEVDNPYMFLFISNPFSDEDWRRVVEILQKHKTNLVSFFANLKVNPPKDAGDFDRSKLIGLAESENNRLIRQNKAFMSTIKLYNRTFNFIDMLIIGTIGWCVFDWNVIGGDIFYHIMVLLGSLVVWFLRTLFPLSDNQKELMSKNAEFVLGKQFISFFYVSATSALVYFFFPLLFMIYWDRSEPGSLFWFTLGGAVVMFLMMLWREVYSCSILDKIKNNETINKSKLENGNSKYGIKNYYCSLSMMIVVDIIMLCINIYMAINYL